MAKDKKKVTKKAVVNKSDDKKSWKDKEVTVSSEPLKVRVEYHKKFTDEDGEEFGELAHINGKDDSVAVDLYLKEDAEIKKGEYALLDTNISLELPAGYKADIKPRSSTFKKYGLLLVNAPGLVDTSYCSSDDVWKMAVYSPITADDLINYTMAVEKMKMKSPKMEKDFYSLKRKFRKMNESGASLFDTIKLKAGTRLCQFEILKTMPDVEFVESDLSKNDGRGCTNITLEKEGGES